MKRPNNNNKFRNNNNNHNHYNPAYSLNYRFDSNSIAGKVSGTALDLIKKYNELAKDAMQDNDYISAEVFRQYAEHYRKIVTDINERKAQHIANRPVRESTAEAAAEVPAQTDIVVETLEEKTEPQPQPETEEAAVRKEFKVIEIAEAPKRVYRKKVEAVAAV